MNLIQGLFGQTEFVCLDKLFHDWMFSNKQHNATIQYSTSRKSLNKHVMSGRALRLRPPTHRTVCLAFVCIRPRASTLVCVRLRTSMCVCEPSTVKSNFRQYLSSKGQNYASYRHEIKTIVRPRLLNKTYPRIKQALPRIR